MKKSVICLLLATSSIFLLGCGGSTEEGKEAGKNETAVEETQKTETEEANTEESAEGEEETVASLDKLSDKQIVSLFNKADDTMVDIYKNKIEHGNRIAKDGETYKAYVQLKDSFGKDEFTKIVNTHFTGKLVEVYGEVLMSDGKPYIYADTFFTQNIMATDTLTVLNKEKVSDKKMNIKILNSSKFSQCDFEVLDYSIELIDGLVKINKAEVLDPYGFRVIDVINILEESYDKMDKDATTTVIKEIRELTKVIPNDSGKDDITPYLEKLDAIEGNLKDVENPTIEYKSVLDIGKVAYETIDISTIG